VPIRVDDLSITSLDEETRLDTVREAAGILRLTENHLYSLIRSGQLPGVVRWGRTIRIRHSAIVDFIEEHTLS
jgi:excisionase family DNA binding protein